MFNRFALKLKKLVIPCPENNYRPGILESRVLIYYIVFLLVLKVFFISFIVCLPKTSFFADISQSLLVELTNEKRESLGLNSLENNEVLQEAAYLKAQDMIKNGYFSHESPSGISPWRWFEKAGYNYRAAGENLGIGFLDSEEIYRAWYDSPSHRENLLNPLYKDIGIAVLKGDFHGSETTIVVQLFGSEKAVSAETEELFKEEDSEEETSEVLTEGEVESEVVQGSEEELIIGEEEKEAEQEVAKAEDSGINGKALGQSYSAFSDEEAEKGLLAGFLKFMVKDYNNLVQRITFYSLLFITLLLIVNVFVKFNVQHKDLIVKAVSFSIILIIFVLLNKEFVIEAIPHAMFLNIF